MTDLNNPVIAAFITVAGIDLVISADNKRVDGCRIGYDTMKGVLHGTPVSVELTDDDSLISVEYGDMTLGLKQQPKGHYFSPLRPAAPKADTADIAFARKAIAQAALARAKGKK